MKRCERCQTEVPEEAAFCSACGLQFQRAPQTHLDVAAPNRKVAANLNKVNKIKLDDMKKFKSFYVYIILSVLFILMGIANDGVSGAFFSLFGLNIFWLFFALISPKIATFGMIDSRIIAGLFFLVIFGFMGVMGDITQSPESKARRVAEQQQKVAAENAAKQQKKDKELAEKAALEKKRAQEEADKIALEKKRAEEAMQRAQREKEQLLSAPYLNFQELSRYPDRYFGKPVQFYGKVVQVMEEGSKVQMRVSTRQSSIGWFDDLVLVIYQRGRDEARILEDDMLRVYGRYQGIIKYKAVMGNEVSIPSIDAKIVNR